MGLFQDGNVVYPPKVGDSLTVKIIGPVERVQNVGGVNNYKNKNQQDCGYYDVMPIEGGKQLKINTWKMYFALKDIQETLDVGDTIEIIHADKGEYIIQKIEK